MEALRFPWGSDDDRRGRPPTQGTARPRATRPVATRSRSQARKSASRRPAPGMQQPETRSATVVARPRPAGLRVAGPRVGPTTSVPSREPLRDPVAGRVVQGPQRQRHEPDYLVLLAAIGLSAIGILMVYSSAGVRAAVSGSVFDAVATQLMWAFLGVAVLIFCMRLDYRLLRLFSVLGFGVTVGFLVLVLLPEMPPLIMPKEVGGASRWLRIGGLPAFHPAEFAKLALVVYLAHWLTTRGRDVSSLRRGLLPFLVIAGSVIGLVAVEPDLGTTGVIALTAFAMFFVAGGSIWQLALLVPVGVAAVAAFVSTRDYQLARWETFLDPWKVASDDGLQTVHGIYALALGGPFGQGLGVSRQPGGLLLPNAENDFIFAVVGQELGLAGGLLVIGFFLLLAWRGIRVALAAPDTFGGLVALGITAWLTFQAFINIGVVVNLLPLTGLPLPFVSDGGTSLVVSLAAVGILLSISRETLPRGDPTHEDPDRGRGHRRPHLPRPGRRDPALDAAA